MLLCCRAVFEPLRATGEVQRGAARQKVVPQVVLYGAPLHRESHFGQAGAASQPQAAKYFLKPGPMRMLAVPQPALAHSHQKPCLPEKERLPVRGAAQRQIRCDRKF